MPFFLVFCYSFLIYAFEEVVQRFLPLDFERNLETKVYKINFIEKIHSDEINQISDKSVKVCNYNISIFASEMMIENVTISLTMGRRGVAA